jgi:hypothetical protein
MSNKLLHTNLTKRYNVYTPYVDEDKILLYRYTYNAITYVLSYDGRIKHVCKLNFVWERYISINEIGQFIE